MRKKRKRRKRKPTLLDIYHSIRKTWEFNPKTRVVDKDKKKKSRAQIKREFRRKCEEEK